MKALQSNVTSPRPFTMTIRDEEINLQKRRKLSCSDIVSHCFHSNHVPAHVFLPMYELVAKQSQNLHEERVDSQIKNLLTQMRSFHLSCSSELHSTNLLQTESLRKQISDITNFKATPYRSHIFQEQKRNEKGIVEQLRQVRIKARAEEMMKQSSLPFTQRQHVHHGNSCFFVHKQRSLLPTGTVKMQEVMNNTQNNLELNYVRQNKLVNLKPKFKNSSTMNQGVYFVQPKGTGKLVSFRHTKTSQLRRVNRQKEKERIDEENEKALAINSRHKTLQIQLQKELALKVKMHNQLLCSQDVIRAKLLSYKHSQQKHLEEYQVGLQEMSQRLRNRPLLIEQHIQQASKDAAIKRIQSRKMSLLSVEANTSSDTQSQDSHSDINKIETSEDSP